MMIPVFPTLISLSGISLTLKTSDIEFEGRTPNMTGDCLPFKDVTSFIAKETEKNMPIIVIDMKGMKGKDISTEMLKKTRVRGREIWIMTLIEETEDIMDAFNTDANIALMPYHFIRSDSVLSDILSLSDNCIPALFADKMNVFTRNGTEDLRDTVDKLKMLGFQRIAVFETSNSFDEGYLREIHSISESIIPFVKVDTESDLKTLDDIGFENVMVSGVKMFRSISKRCEIQSCTSP